MRGTHGECKFFRTFVADMENKKLTPLRFAPCGIEEQPWGRADYLLADLGLVDSLCTEGCLKGSTLSDILQTYLERLVGETSFDWYGTQFPVLVKRLTVRGRTSLHITMDDETAEQRYDAFGKTALWLVEAAGAEAKLYLGLKKETGARQFFQACQDGSAAKYLHTVTPRPGETYLITPGMVHAAQDVTLLEIAESSEAWFRIWDWGATERETELEEAFDLIDFGPWQRPARLAEGLLAATPQFTVNRIGLTQPLKSTRDEEDTFLLYYCTRGKAQLQAWGRNYALAPGELLLVPAEVTEFFLLPEAPDTELLEVRMDPRPEEDLVAPAEEE